MEPKKYMNPYLAGVLLGLVLLLANFVSGRGLGASGSIKSFGAYVVEKVAPQHAQNTKYYQEYSADHAGNPLKNWLVFEILGVIIGAFISGLVSNRLDFKLEKGPKVQTNTVRIISAIIGGFLFGLGAQLGRGCTSGAALSGMAVFSTGGIITLFAIFGGAYAFAYFFRKLWL
jgi:hypothetical protein